MSATITITNDFHGTSTTIRPKNGRVTARARYDARRRLCGMADCTCADGGKLSLAWEWRVLPDGTLDTVPAR